MGNLMINKINNCYRLTSHYANINYSARILPLFNRVFFTLLCCCFLQGYQAVANDEITVKPTVVEIMTPDKYALGGDYFAGEAKAPGVMILHDCRFDSKAYTQLGKVIASHGIHVLIPDFRGFGASKSELYSHDNLKAEASNLSAYENAFATLASYWEADTLTAYQFLRRKMAKKTNVSVISVGCSAGVAVALAEKAYIHSMVMITPKMDVADKERYKNLIDIPSYFINASHHISTFETSKELFEWNGSKRSKAQIYKSDRDDYSLLASQKYLAEGIAFWLKSNFGY